MPKTDTATLRPDSPSSASLLPSLSGLLREWLPRQRWFAGKGRPVTDLALLSVTELHPGCLHVLIRADYAELSAIGGPGTTPAHDCYQLFLGIDELLPPLPPRAVLGRAGE